MIQSKDNPQNIGSNWRYRWQTGDSVRWIRRAAPCLLLPLLISCATPDGNADGAPFDLDPIAEQSAEIIARVKAALVADSNVTAASIQVDYIPASTDEADSTRPSSTASLRLSGFVDDEAERERALAIAGDASEGATLIDELQVR